MRLLRPGVVSGVLGVLLAPVLARAQDSTPRSDSAAPEAAPAPSEGSATGWTSPPAASDATQGEAQRASDAGTEAAAEPDTGAETGAETAAEGEATEEGPSAEPDPLDPGASDLSHERRVAWRGDFLRAKQLLRQGRFVDAALILERLAGCAPDPSAAAAARELAALARYWTAHDVRLVTPDPPSSPETSSAQGSPSNASWYRTTDEIGQLYVNAFAYGIGTGIWVGALTEPQTPSALLLPTVLVTGASLGVVAYVDRGKGLRYGVPQSISAGMYVGFSQALLWTLAHEAQAHYRDEWEESTVATLMWGGATLGAITGGVIGQRAGTTPGRAAWVSSTALWGGLLGGFGVGGTVPDDHKADERALLGAALFSSAGTLAGLATAGPLSPSLARVRFIDLGGALGGLLGLGLYATMDDRLEPRPSFWAMNLGAMAGLTTAWFLTAEMEQDFGPSAAEADRARSSSPLSSLLHARPTVLPTEGGGQLGLVGLW